MREITSGKRQSISLGRIKGLGRSALNQHPQLRRDPASPTVPWQSKKISLPFFIEGKPQFSFWIAALGVKRFSISTRMLGMAVVWGQARSIVSKHGDHREFPESLRS